jgi:hypothetical protein
MGSWELSALLYPFSPVFLSGKRQGFAAHEAIFSIFETEEWSRIGQLPVRSHDYCDQNLFQGHPKRGGYWV